MEFVLLLLHALSIAVVVDTVLSWVVPNPQAFPRTVTHVVAEPLCRPFRQLLKPEALGGIDISPMAAILTLNVLGGLVRTLSANSLPY